MEDHCVTSTIILDNLRRIFQTINDHARSAEKEAGITSHQLWALKIIDTSEPIRVCDLARAMHISSPTVVGILDRLAAKHLVQRVPAADDRRAVHIYLTDEARLLLTTAPEVLQVTLLNGLSTMNPEELDKVHTGLALMVTLLKADNIIPQPMHS